MLNANFHFAKPTKASYLFRVVLLCYLNVTLCIKSLSTHIINIENLFQMFDVLVSWADQTVNLCRITDFWITETITVEEKALDSAKKGKITKVIDEETVVVQWNSSEKDTMKLSDLVWTNNNSFMGRSFQWAADSTWVGTIIKEDTTRFNPKIHLRGKVSLKEQDSLTESEQDESSGDDQSSDGFSSDDDVTLGSLKACHNDVVTKWSGSVRWHSCEDKLGEYPFAKDRKTASAVRDPINYLEDYFDDEFVKLCCDMSNKYAKQKVINSTFNLTPEDFRIFMGTVFYMSLFGMNNCRRYWSAHSRISLVADQIPINQWEKIKSNLHFVDNSEGNTGDRLFKVKPVIEKFNSVAMTIDKEEFCSVDENTIPYKGHSQITKTSNWLSTTGSAVPF